MKIGKVYLVGAGPGDVQLITVKGAELIQQAEVILYDRLVNPKLLELANPNCELVYCGKLPNRHTMRQETINSQLVAKAKEGKIVVRLKGGDPGVFGRVGEEAEELARHGIPFEIVPGVTSGIAAPLYAGIPVTHRQYGESFALITAHDQSKDGKPLLNWAALAKGIDTIAFYMGVSNLLFICENLMKHGKSPNTPVILIQWGTMGRQKTLEGTLATIANQAKAVQFSNPAITLVGELVSIRKKISWFEKKPLFGRQILLARTDCNESALAKELMKQGADVIEFPKWKTVQTKENEEILNKIETYEKILFTSSGSIDYFFEALLKHKIDIRKIQAKLFGYSDKLTKKLNERGFMATTSKSLHRFADGLIVGDSSFETQVAASGVWVTHEKQMDVQFIPMFFRMFEEVRLDTVVFPNAVSVLAFVHGLNEMNRKLEYILKRLPIVCVGNETKVQLEHLGFSSSNLTVLSTEDDLLNYLPHMNNMEFAQMI